MLEFSDARYQFFPSEPSPALIRLGQFLNRRVILPGKNHRIAEISVSGETEALREAVREARERGDRLLFVMNHPSHSDPQVITEVHRRLGQPSCFMAAYDVFLRSRFSAWSMQKLGHFSIDREAADRKAMAAAVEILTAGEYALNIFPEGNVYLTNDRVTPFLDGTAFIALKAQQTLDTAGIRIVPISLKFTHLTTPRATVTNRLLQLGRDSGYTFPDGATADPVKSIFGLGQHILTRFLSRHGFEREMTSSERSVYDSLTQFADSLVTKLESSLELPAPKEGGLIERIRRIRSTIHQIRMSPEDGSRSAHEIDGLADEAILALRIHGYLAPYLSLDPTIDRYDETVERVAEDFYSRAMPRTGPRRALVELHAPIDVREHLRDGGGKLRNAVGSLTRAMEEAVQTGVDRLNRGNDAEGARLVSSSE